MPKNPSKRQQEASRNNLRGNYGPNTEEGKQKVALNGLRNKGTKTAKARAKQIAGRHGPKTKTFYSYACLNCKKLCLWPSFSLETPLDKMPLGCLKEVLEEKPERCFYYFEGFCLGTYAGNQGSAGGAAPCCILDDGFAEHAARRLGKRVELAVRVELNERKRIWRLKKEMEGYLETLRRQGPNNTVWTPRMVYVSREIHTIIKACRICRLEPWRSLANLDELLEKLYWGDLPFARTR